VQNNASNQLDEVNISGNTIHRPNPEMKPTQPKRFMHRLVSALAAEPLAGDDDGYSTEKTGLASPRSIQDQPVSAAVEVYQRGSGERNRGTTFGSVLRYGLLWTG
jgi:hypothetical protein